MTSFFKQILLLLLSSYTVVAAAKSTLNDIAAKYRKANLVTVQLTKSVKSNLLGKESIYKGTMYLAPNKFRLNIDEPEKSQIIFDGKTIWSVQYPSKELPGPLQVAKSKLDKNTRKQILISTLLSKGGLKENFKTLKEEKIENTTRVTLTPLKGDLNLKNLEITLKENKIISLYYIDDVGNSTRMEFEKTEFSNKPANQLFKFKPPKEAQVTNL